MIKKLSIFLKKHPLRILLWVSVATISGFVTWIILLSPETKVLRMPQACKIPLPQIPLEFIEPANPKEFGASETSHEAPKNDLCWEKNAIAFNGSKDLSKFVVVLTGLGLNQDLTIQAIKELPPYITLSFSPYTYDLDAWVEKAKEAQHEVLIDLPITQKGEMICDGGPLAIDSTLSLDDNLKRMEELCQKASKSIGFNAIDFKASKPDLWESLKKEADQKGLLWVSVDSDLAPIFLQSNVLPEDFLKQLQECEHQCVSTKKQIVMMDINPAMISFVQDWAKNLTDKSFVLAPLTSILKSDA